MKEYQREKTRRMAVVATAIFFGSALVPVPAVAQLQRVITVVMPAEPPNLDGCESAATLQGSVLRQNVVETLMQKTAKDGELIPRLATSWERVDDSTWQVKLRQGVSFHDGSPLNAVNAKRSIDRTLSKTIVCSDRTKGFADLSVEVAASDEFTLRIKTSRPDSILPMRLAGVAIVGPNTPLDQKTLTAIGTGPYAIENWQVSKSRLSATISIGDLSPRPKVRGIFGVRNPRLERPWSRLVRLISAMQ